MDEPLSEYQGAVLAYAESGVWALVVVGCILVFALGIFVVKAVW